MECTYVHVMSNLNNTSVGKNMHFYDSHFKTLHQSKICGALIDNRADAPICALEGKDRETKKKFRHALIELFCGLCHV